ncbi:high mobility group protein 20A [Eurosta solidaginis]|uniref:high mobility group protein 20A n=1 Tax=Eurosta solidaginis TaxID=178769 RepID=UPI0035310F7A
MSATSVTNNSMPVNPIPDTRTKESKATTTTENLTDMNAAGGISDTSDKDMDIEIIEIPSTKILTTSGKLKINENQREQPPHNAKLITSKISGGTKQIDQDIPIISISDGEDSAGQSTPTAQKVSRKRGSGGGGSTASEDDQSFRLKRRKIKVAGAPKMPLTGYVRYMNDRREILRKEFPTKTAMEHTKMIGEEWQKMTEEKKAPYMKAAEVDKQRYLAELNTFLKEHPDVLACELAKNKQVRKSQGELVKPVLKEKSQSIGNIKSPNKETNTTNTSVTKETTQHNTEKDNSTLPSQTTATATTVDVRSRRKHTPTPTLTNVGGATNSNANTNHISTRTNNTSRLSSNNSNNNHSLNSNSSNNNSTHTATITLPTISTANIAKSLLNTTAVPAEIPIFTNEFLEHNKIFDMELRTLRKSKQDLEQQNSVLEKHVENMKFGVEKMTNENDELAEKNRLLELYLDKLKSKLAHALSGLSIPSQPNGATMDNIEKYMNDLYKMATTNTHGPASLNKAKDIIRKLDLQINL